MSRSKRPQCSSGRGCGCCGNAGAARRRRERSWMKADGITSAQIEIDKETGGKHHHDPYYQGKHHRPWKSRRTS